MDVQKQIAELNRKLEELRLHVHDALSEEEEEESSEDKATGLATMMSSIQMGLQASFDPLKKAIERDAQKDGEMVSAVAALTEEVKGLRTDIQAHGQVFERIFSVLDLLSQPEERTGTVDLPSGPVRMTVTASRKKRVTQ